MKPSWAKPRTWISCSVANVVQNLLEKNIGFLSRFQVANWWPKLSTVFSHNAVHFLAALLVTT